jgi:acetoin utilization protein AcuB
MLVKRWMSQPVISVDINDTVRIANILQAENNIRSLPVLEEGKLVGIVTDRDLKRASVSDALGIEENELAYLNTRIKIGKIMTRNPLTVTASKTVEQVAKILYDKKISAMPVVDDKGQLIGMISQGDVFRLLISITGIEDKGIQIALLIKDESGSIKEIADIIRTYGGRVGNLLTSYDDVPNGYREVFFKSNQLDFEKLDEFIAELRKNGTIRYILEYPGGEEEARIILMEID